MAYVVLLGREDDLETIYASAPDEGRDVKVVGPHWVKDSSDPGIYKFATHEEAEAFADALPGKGVISKHIGVL